MIELLSIVAGIGTAASSANGVIELINKVKKLITGEKGKEAAMPQFAQPQQSFAPAMAPFASQMTNPYGNGNQWLPNLQAVAQQNGNPWVPHETQPLLGVNLTGIWVPPGNPYDQSFIRQYGPYINVIAGVAGTPTVMAEGLFDPTHRIIHVVGRTVYGAPFESRAQLFPNWTLQGWMTGVNYMGQPMNLPLSMAKVA